MIDLAYGTRRSDTRQALQNVMLDGSLAMRSAALAWQATFDHRLMLVRHIGHRAYSIERVLRAWHWQPKNRLI